MSVKKRVVQKPIFSTNVIIMIYKLQNGLQYI